MKTQTNGRSTLHISFPKATNIRPADSILTAKTVARVVGVVDIVDRQDTPLRIIARATAIIVNRVGAAILTVMVDKAGNKVFDNAAADFVI